VTATRTGHPRAASGGADRPLWSFPVYGRSSPQRPPFPQPATRRAARRSPVQSTSS